MNVFSTRRAVLLKCTASFCALMAWVSSATATVSWSPSGIEGAGSENALAIQPGGTGVLVDGADVGGFMRSTNYGKDWHPSNVGTPVDRASEIAAVIFSNDPQQTNTVYAGTGNMGSGGGFLVSTNAGQSWTRRSTVPQFSGNGETDIPGLPNRWPRSTGNLIAVDETGPSKYIYAGTFKDGVMRSTDGGATWTTIGLSTKYIRSIVLDPGSPGTLYVAAYSNYVWKITTARTTSGTGTNGWIQLVNAPNKVEEMIMIGSNLYAAGKDDIIGGGVWKSNDGGTNWTRLGGSALSTDTTWTGINGFHSGSSDVLFAGSTDAVWDGGGYYKNVMRSMDGGATWANITKAGDVMLTVGGPDGEPWWLMTTASYYQLGHGACDCAMIQIDPANHNRVLFCGRAGVWETTNAMATTPVWYPMVRGLSVSGNAWVAADPNHPERMYVAIHDWTFVYSTNHGTTFARNRPPGSDTYGNFVYVAPLNSCVYLASSDQSNTNGEIFSNPNPTLPSAVWTNENLSSLTQNKTRGLVVGRDASNNRVILAAVQYKGIYRKVGSTWAQVNSTIKAGGTGKLQFAWNAGSSNVFLYDRSSGIWRSKDYGVNWSKIWAHPSSGDNSAFLVEDPDQEGLLYISASDAVWRMTNAHLGTAVSNGIPVPVDMGGAADPGSVALANGVLYACDVVASGHNARLYQWLNPATSTSSANLADAVIYPGMAQWPSALAVSSDNYIYCSQNHNGSIIGTPTGISPPPAPAGLSATAGTNQVSLSWSASAGANGYNVKRSTTSGAEATIASVATTQYLDTGLAGGTIYYYQVSATNSAGESPNSAEVSATAQSSLPAPYRDADIGAVGLAGGASCSSGLWTVAGAGANIYDTNDAFNFVYRPWTGDVEIITRVVAFGGPSDTHAKAGIMIRQDLTANSPHATTDVQYSSGIEFLRRYTTGGTATNIHVSGLTAPFWLHLVRSGNTIAASYSPNRVNWTNLATDTVLMTDPVYVGLVVNSHNADSLCASTFDNFIVSPPGRLVFSLAGGNSQINLSWQGAWVLQSKAVLDNNPATWVDVPNATSPYTVPVLPQGAQFFRLRGP